MSTQLDVVIISKNQIEREGLHRLLTEAAFRAVGVHSGHLELDLGEAPGDPGIVLINAAADEEVLEGCRYIREQWPEWKIVVFAADCQSQTVFDAFAAGVDGYVGKHISVDGLAEMIKLVALGEKVIPSQVFFDMAALKAERPTGGCQLSLGEANLSDREMEILECLIRGDTNKIISRLMKITEATVKVHVKSILRKLGVMNRTQAAIWGITRGMTGTEAARPSTPFPRNGAETIDSKAPRHTIGAVL